MIKLIATVILLFFFAGLLAQEESNKKIISGGVFLAPCISYRIISANDEYYQWFTDYRNINEKPAYYFTSGIKLNLDFNNSYGLETGINYLENGFALKKIGLHNNTDSYTHFSNKLKYSFIEIPAGFKYYITKNKAKFYTSLGVTLGVHLSNSITNHYFKNDKLVRNEVYKNILDVHQFVFSMYWGIGIKYPLSDNAYLFANSVITQNITSVIKPDVNEHLTYGSLRFGVMKNL